MVLPRNLSSGTTVSAPGSRGCSGSLAGLCPGAICTESWTQGAFSCHKQPQPCHGSRLCSVLWDSLQRGWTGVPEETKRLQLKPDVGGWAGKSGEGEGDSQSSSCWKDEEREWELSSEEETMHTGIVSVETLPQFVQLRSWYPS